MNKLNKLNLTLEDRKELIVFIKGNREAFVSLMKEIPEELRRGTLINLIKVLRGEMKI